MIMDCSFKGAMVENYSSLYRSSLHVRGLAVYVDRNSYGNKYITLHYARSSEDLCILILHFCQQINLNIPHFSFKCNAMHKWTRDTPPKPPGHPDYLVLQHTAYVTVNCTHYVSRKISIAVWCVRPLKRHLTGLLSLPQSEKYERVNAKETSPEWALHLIPTLTWWCNHLYEMLNDLSFCFDLNWLPIAFLRV